MPLLPTVLAMTSCLSGVARGTETTPSEESLTPASNETLEEPSGLHFRSEWRRSSVWDYVAAAGAVGVFFLIHSQPDLKRAHWTKPLPLDRETFDAVELRSRRARNHAHSWSDHARLVNLVHPILGATSIALIRGGGLDMAWEMSVMNIQAFAFNAIGQRGSHKTAGRTRPAKERCDDDPEYDKRCGRDWMHESFYGGHVAVAFTGAGLACAHHLEAELLGNPWADAIACGVGVTSASVVATTRMMNGAHWLSDNIVGGGIGFFTGWGTATLLHYRPFWRARDDNQPVPLALTPHPAAPGLQLSGRF